MIIAWPGGNNKLIHKLCLDIRQDKFEKKRRIVRNDGFEHRFKDVSKE